MTTRRKFIQQSILAGSAIYVSGLTGFAQDKSYRTKDISGFAKKGGVIEFVMDANKIRFEVNIATAEGKGMKISSQLLQLAKEVYKNKQ